MATSDDRKKTAWRARRIIYNDDGADAAAPGADTPDGFLNIRLAPLSGTQVDTVCYNTNNGAMVCGHTSTVAEMLGKYVDSQSAPLFRTWTNNLTALERLGTDPLALAREFTREHGMELFWSLRMNDLHDGGHNEMFTTFKREHPQRLLGRREDCAKHPPEDPRQCWTAMDYEQSANRDYMFRIIEDVGRRYDVDGIELDYFRFPLYFRRNLTLLPATQRDIDVLTALQRRVATFVRERSRDRQRIMLLAARVPLTVDKCRYIGIDIEQWLSEGLVDVLITGGGYEPLTMPVGELADFGHRHEVPVYPCISNSGLQRDHQRIEAWRAAAANAHHAGADGVYTFNLFPSSREIVTEDGHQLTTGPQWLQVLHEIGDVATLAGKDKMFGIDRAIMLPTLSHASPCPDGLPREIGEALNVVVPVYEDVNEVQGGRPLEMVTLRLRITNLRDRADLHVRWNGVRIETSRALDSAAEVDGHWVRCSLPRELIHRGENRMLLTRPPQSPDHSLLEDVQLWMSSGL